MADLIEESYGIVPLKKFDDAWRVLLILHLHGNHWGFPKGKKEKEEAPDKTASRELEEETGLCVKKLLSNQPFTEHYEYTRSGKTIAKTVGYYPAEVHGHLSLQTHEVRAAKWVTLEEAISQLTFDEAKDVCRKAMETLT